MRSLPGTVLIWLGALSACMPQRAPMPPLEPQQPAGFPEAYYRAALERGEAVYRVVPERSEVLIYAYRGGTLARFGHDHVIAARDVRGYVQLADARTPRGRADLYVRLAALEVDGAPERSAAGFTTRLSEDDIARTRRNMLEQVLEASRFPFAWARIRAASDSVPGPLEVELDLHGVTRRLLVAAAIDRRAGQLHTSGAFSLLQTEFGITPYSVLGGALQVQDRIDLRFRIEAERLAPLAERSPGRAMGAHGKAARSVRPRARARHCGHATLMPSIRPGVRVPRRRRAAR